MASEKDICIYALQHIGQFADMVSLDEDSQHAAVAKTAYPFVRDAMLERHTWNFATAKKRVARIENEEDEAAFPIPADCLRVAKVDVTDARSYDDIDWEVRLVGDVRCVVLTGGWHARGKKEIVLSYVRRITNTAVFSAGFVEALSWNLAAEIAGPIVKGDTGINVAQKLVQYAQAFESKAISVDASQGRERKRTPLAPWHGGFGFFYEKRETRYPTPMDERGDFEA